MRRREGGTKVRRPRALSQQGTRTASGLPPGTTRSPCQELADDGALARPPAKPESGARCRKCRDWRADRRPPHLATDADTIGLRLSARHPPQGDRRVGNVFVDHAETRLVGTAGNCAFAHPTITRTRDASRQGARMSATTPGNCPGPRQSLHLRRTSSRDEAFLGNAMRQCLPARQRDGLVCRLRPHRAGDRRLGVAQPGVAPRHHGQAAGTLSAARGRERLTA